MQIPRALWILAKSLDFIKEQRGSSLKHQQCSISYLLLGNKSSQNSTYNNQNHLFFLSQYLWVKNGWFHWLVLVWVSRGLQSDTSQGCGGHLKASLGWRPVSKPAHSHGCQVGAGFLAKLRPLHRAAWASSQPVCWLLQPKCFNRLRGKLHAFYHQSQKSHPVPLCPWYYFRYSLDSVCDGTMQGHNCQGVKTTGDRLRGWLLQMSLHFLAC